jgi:hypothetical protein
MLLADDSAAQIADSKNRQISSIFRVPLLREGTLIGVLVLVRRSGQAGTRQMPAKS